MSGTLHSDSSSLTSVISMTFDNIGNLYSTINFSGTIILIDNNGSGSTFIDDTPGDHSVTNIVYYNDYLYISELNTTSIWYVNINNAATFQPFVTLPNNVLPYGSVIYNSYLYVVTFNSNGTFAGVYKVDLTNTQQPSLFISPNSPTPVFDNNGASYIQIDSNGNYYITDLNNVYKFNNLGEYVGIFLSNVTFNNILLNNNIFYFNDSNTNKISVYNINGILINNNYANAGCAPFGGGLAIKNNNFYFTNYIDNGINTTSFIYFLPISSIYPITCFNENTKILCDKGYIPIQNLRKGDLIKTLKNGFIPIDMIGKRDIYHPAVNERIKDQLYICNKENYPELLEDLILTGCHSILVENSIKIVNKEQIEKVIEVNGAIFITDDKLRLPACVDDRTSILPKPGNYTIYHFALENNDYYMNYGIYANGLLVETCSKRYLKELSNMTLIE